MRTSKLAKETANVASRLLSATSPPRRKSSRTTRSTNALFAQYSAQSAGSSASAVKIKKPELKTEDSEEDSNSDSSSLSSVQWSDASSDIEDAPFSKRLPIRKRKRNTGTPVTSADASIARNSAQKRAVKAEETQDIKVEQLPTSSLPKRKPKKQAARKRVDEATGEVTIHPPANWEEIYSAVQEIRKRIIAPVDTMGCERLAQESASPKVSQSLLPPLIYLTASRTSASRL